MGRLADVNVVCIDFTPLEYKRRSDNLQWILEIDSEIEKSLEGVLVRSVPQRTGAICHLWHTIDEYEVYSIWSAVPDRSIQGT